MVSSLEDYFGEEKELEKKAVFGKVEETENGYLLSAEKDEIALVNFGMREPSLLLECDISLGKNGYAGFAFGEGDNYGKYTGLVLDSKNNCIHYEGCVLSRMAYIEPLITTNFSFEPDRKYHVKLVMENEIAVLYVDDTKVLSNRIQKSINGADMGIFSSNTQASFTDITIKLPDGK